MSVEGIPDGWKLVRVGKVKPGEVRVAADGTPAEWNSVESDSANYVIIRKIEKPKQFRPFANAAEFEPHRDRWICHPNVKEKKFRIAAYDDNMIWSNDRGYQYSNLFESGTLFEDGTPFGVEVTE